MQNDEQLVCPQCGGKGQLIPVFVVGLKPGAQLPGALDCPACSGCGQITMTQHVRMLAGQTLKELRKEAGFGLREGAKLLYLLPSLLSRMECGRDSLTLILQVYAQAQRDYRSGAALRRD